MKKYIKWILLSILIISILITVILFINFAKENNNNLGTNHAENNEKDILENFYNKNLYFLNMTIYENNEEIFRSNYNDGKYIVINNQTIKYCYSSNSECKVDNYTYDNNKISIKTYNTLGPGDYKVEVLDEMLKLSRKEKDKTISYCFEEAKG